MCFLLYTIIKILSMIPRIFSQRLKVKILIIKSGGGVFNVYIFYMLSYSLFIITLLFLYSISIRKFSLIVVFINVKN